MNKIIGFVLLFAVLALLPCLSSAQEVRKGDSATVPGWQWVDVKNPEGVRNGNVDFSFGESCGIQQGGKMTVIGIEKENVLVRYSVRGEQYGTPCPSGTIFFLTKVLFSGMTENYQRNITREKAEKNLIRKLIGG